ncbi:EAL domain-containing protein [Aminipila sp.]|uniref:EAL domain-containing protein n=1 Tax=Aminipila sp. TaxID=2060095 RepID=UPI0028A2CB1A|nr:EAL domain-containing protein [Aminipila sp.]
MNSKEANKNTKLERAANHFDFHSITVKLLLFLFLLIIVEAVVFMCSFYISNLIGTAIMAASVSGVIVALTIIKIFTSPIKELIRAVIDIDPMHPVTLRKTNIRELDLLAKTIEILSSTSADTASKMSNVLDVAGRAMAIFEIYKEADTVYITKHLFPILEEPDAALYKTGFIPANVFRAKMSKFERYLVTNQSTKNSSVFHVERSNNSSKWIRITTIQGDNKELGLVEDITEEMLRKTKMEFERDYDVLTSLLNRRAFQANVQQSFSNPEFVSIGAMVSIDLDNLKFINDTYGHDYGDEYIRSMANVLTVTCPNNSVISRQGGDEFAVFMYGYQSKEQIRAEIIKLNISINNKAFNLPDTITHLSASMGVAWYPDDTTSYSQLIKYADFAMYSVKKTTKGSFAEFVLNSYEKDSYLTGLSVYLEEFIKNRMFEYTFQPIVSAKTGVIFAYEALIKSKHPSIKNPKQLFELAKSRVELYEIERLTWHESLTAFEQLNALPSIKLFINSISDQILDTEDKNTLERNFCHLLKQVVVEINDNDHGNLDYTKAKLDFIRNWGGEIAVDDYGTSSYDEDSFNIISPKYLKIDISITQNLYKDNNRHKLVESIVSFAHQRNISVIAEGIEKPEDMFALIDIGVDYLQGYHICKPASEPPKMLAITTAQIANYNKRKAEQLIS